MNDFSSADQPQERTLEQKLQRAQSLVGSSSGRPDFDFYPTPAAATQALLDVETFTGSIWEPACGDGAICKVLTANGYQNQIATDLIYRGYGEGDHDFFTSPLSAANVITNPPFSLGQRFVEHALARTTRKVVMLTKLAFLEGAKRRVMFETTPLARVWVFSKRISFYRDGEKGSYSSSMIAFAWLVWEHGYTGKPQLGWL